jgi:hypothetical protein
VIKSVQGGKGSVLQTIHPTAPAAIQRRSSPSTPPRFVPYRAADTRLPEFTLRAVLVGTVLGMIFGASSLYLVLKVG